MWESGLMSEVREKVMEIEMAEMKTGLLSKLAFWRRGGSRLASLRASA